MKSENMNTEAGIITSDSPVATALAVRPNMHTNTELTSEADGESEAHIATLESERDRLKTQVEALEYTVGTLNTKIAEMTKKESVSSVSDEIMIPGLVNRQRVFKTLEDKAIVGGFRWDDGEIDQPDEVVQDQNGNFKKRILRARVAITDVDGTVKHTIKTDDVDADGNPLNKTAYGVHDGDLAGQYHGKNSSHWKQANLPLSEVIGILNNGYAFAPGHFDAPAGESQRSAKYCIHRSMILFDADEWTAEHPAPKSTDEFLTKYPDVKKEFYWVGESISSRSSLKPELRLRLMLVLPSPVFRSQAELWETIVTSVTAKYPFIAKGVGIDKVRLSYGNAREDCENRILGGLATHQQFDAWIQRSHDQLAEKATADAEKSLARKEQQDKRKEQSEQTKQLRRNGSEVKSESLRNPIEVFQETSPEALLERFGLGTRLRGEEWNYHGSSPGRSFVLTGSTIKPFSNTMQNDSPAADSTAPVNAHRFIAYKIYGLDMKDAPKEVMDELRVKLFNDGYGDDPAEYRNQRKKERREYKQISANAKRKDRISEILTRRGINNE